MTDGDTRFDMADFLRDEEDISLYLDEVASENDPEALVMALSTVARARNMSQLARDAGLAEAERTDPSTAGRGHSLAAVMRVADALGYQVSFKAKAAA